MLNRNIVRAAVATIGILLTAAFNNTALGQPFANGDFITQNQNVWGDIPNGTNTASLLVKNYSTVYAPTSGQLEIGIPGPEGFSLLFTGATFVLVYLPAAGASGRLYADQLNPITTFSGMFGGAVLALRLNVDFSDAGLIVGNLGIPFGDLVLTNFSTLPLLNGLTVHQYLDNVHTLLGGGSGIYSISPLLGTTLGLSDSFRGGSVSQFAQDHLRLGTIPGDYNANGTVDAADYVVWRKGLGTIYTQNDYTVWRTHFGQTAGSGSGASSNAAIPEPATLVLLMFAATSWGLPRRRAA